VIQRQITFEAFKVFTRVLNTLTKLGALEQSKLMVTWEQKPKMVLSRMGDIEFENPQEVYGATVTIWDQHGNAVVKKKFNIVGKDGV
jgi:hypothetical protein